MASLEMVDKLRERANVTFDEAREALDMSDGDMLDAVIYLEKQGKIPPPKGGAYSTGAESDAGGDAYGSGRFGYGSRSDYYFDSEMKDAHSKKKRGKSKSANKSGGRGHAYYYDERDRRSGASPFLNDAKRFLIKAFRIGNNTLFEVTRRGDNIIKIPLTLLVAGLIFVFHITVVLLIVGLFLGCRYRLLGNEFNDGPINSAMDSASHAAETIKDTINKNIRN
jgi:hypothetical protein